MSTETDALLEIDELTELKERAERMGIKFHPNISAEKLRAKIEAELTDTESQEEDGEASKYVETVNELRLRKNKEALKLVRVRITNMDPSKANQRGTIITTGNLGLGTVRKYVAFDVEWHIPQIIYEVMRDKKVQVFTTRKDSKGNEITESKLVNAYAIEVLPDLTEAELKDLAQRQAMAKGTN